MPFAHEGSELSPLELFQRQRLGETSGETALRVHSVCSRALRFHILNETERNANDTCPHSNSNASFLTGVHSTSLFNRLVVLWSSFLLLLSFFCTFGLCNIQLTQRLMQLHHCSIKFSPMLQSIQTVALAGGGRHWWWWWCDTVAFVSVVVIVGVVGERWCWCQLLVIAGEWWCWCQWLVIVGVVEEWWC